MLYLGDAAATDTIRIGVGFTEKQAETIARANRGVDFGLFSNPILGDQSWHFNTNNRYKDFKNGISSTGTENDSRQIKADKQMEKAVELYNNGHTYLALRALGKGLHALQDMDAHGDSFVGSILGFRWSHHRIFGIFKNVPEIGESADNPRYEEERFKNTERATEEYLRDFFNRTIGLKTK